MDIIRVSCTNHSRFCLFFAFHWFVLIIVLVNHRVQSTVSSSLLVTDQQLPLIISKNANRNINAKPMSNPHKLIKGGGSGNELNKNKNGKEFNENEMSTVIRSAASRRSSSLYHSLVRLAQRRARPRRSLVVDKGGRGDAKCIQAAVDMVPDNNVFRYVITIHPGIYREKVVVPYNKPFITFKGSGSDVTVVTWNASAGDTGEDGQLLGTFGSASVAVDSDYFIATDITFQNTAPPPMPGAEGMQAVALRVSGDKAAFVDCRMLGCQDTLFDHVGRHLFLRCYIEGAIDFIFGDARSLYLRCELHANALSYGAIAASQRSSPKQNTGFSFVLCKVRGSGVLYLGRAWGQYARVIFSFSYLGNIVVSDGWYDWGDASRRRTVLFGEYKCYGGGANVKGRVYWSRQLSFSEARPFLGLGFINGHKWLHLPKP